MSKTVFLTRCPRCEGIRQAVYRPANGGKGKWFCRECGLELPDECVAPEMKAHAMREDAANGDDAR